MAHDSHGTRATGGDLESEVRRLRREFAETQEQLLVLERRLAQSQRVAALGALVARLAHELGTPLHSISGHLDLMLSDAALPAHLRQRGTIVAGEVERLANLIRSHLRRLRAPDPEPVPTDLNALVSGILQTLEPLVQARAIVVELDLEEEAGAEFPCDRTQIEQAVLNLLKNAIDALPEGGRILLRTTTTACGRAISVCDSGHGIAPEHLGRAFEPFFTTKQPGEGSGMGLALCREIARGHGGDVRLDSSTEHGTVVTLTLMPLPSGRDA